MARKKPIAACVTKLVKDGQNWPNMADIGNLYTIEAYEPI